MKKFTSIQNKKDKPRTAPGEVLYKGNYLNIVNVDAWEVVDEPDCVIIIPYLVEYHEFLMRKEVVPSYQSKEGKDKFLTVMSGTMKEGEKPEETMFRELEEEAGIRLNTGYRNYKLLGKFFMSKGNRAQYHIFYVPLHMGEFQRYAPQGDGSRTEELSTTIRIATEYIDALVVSDTITALSLQYLKKELG